MDYTGYYQRSLSIWREDPSKFTKARLRNLNQKLAKALSLTKQIGRFEILDGDLVQTWTGQGLIPKELLHPQVEENHYSSMR